MKATIIGAGSTYTPELIEGLAERSETLPFEVISLMDIDSKRLEIVGGLAKRQLESAGYRGKVSLTTDSSQALDGASFIFAQVRVGKMGSRIKDEKIPLKYGLLGQETTGAGGFAKALRTVPVIMDIAEQIKRLSADNAWLINFSNPSGIIAEAVLNFTDVNMIGLCNCSVNMVKGIADAIGTVDFDYEYIGLNHLSWITSVVPHGKTQNILTDYLSIAGVQMQNIPGTDYAPQVLKAIPYLPSPYLSYFYKRNEQTQKCLDSEQTRGEVCLELDEKLLSDYADESLHIKPPNLALRGGSLYSLAASSVAEAIALDKGEPHVVAVKNNGAVPFMDDDDVVELICDIGKDCAKPRKVSTFNDYIVGMMQAVKAYEKLTVRAAMQGDRDAALAALMVHPLIGDSEKAIPLLDDILETNREFLPRFFS